MDYSTENEQSDDDDWLDRLNESFDRVDEDFPFPDLYEDENEVIHPVPGPMASEQELVPEVPKPDEVGIHLT